MDLQNNIPQSENIQPQSQVSIPSIPPQQQVSQVIPSQTTQKKSSKWVWVIASIIVLLIGIGIGIFIHYSTIIKIIPLP